MSTMIGREKIPLISSLDRSKKASKQSIYWTFENDVDQILFDTCTSDGPIFPSILCQFSNSNNWCAFNTSWTDWIEIWTTISNIDHWSSRSFLPRDRSKTLLLILLRFSFYIRKKILVYFTQWIRMIWRRSVHLEKHFHYNSEKKFVFLVRWAFRSMEDFFFLLVRSI